MTPLVFRSPRLYLKRIKARLRGEKLDVISLLDVVEVEQDGVRYKFVCSTDKEVRRAHKMFAKEPGTIAWLSQSLRPDDVFYDIGANIGLYTLFAARRLGPSGLVYSFEPHLPNAASLLSNVEANGLTDRVQIIAIPLSGKDGFDQFHYFSVMHATSSSQFGAADLNGAPFQPVASEIKYGCRLQTLVASGGLRRPTLMKIDVDGREPDLIEGMEDLLRSPEAPREVQVELERLTADRVTAQMENCGFRAGSCHWAKSHQVNMDQGADPAAEYPRNVIFAKT